MAKETFVETLSGLPFFAKRARATENGVNIDNALAQKQGDLGISASGDAGKFLNQQGQWISASGTPYQNNPEMDGTASAGSSSQFSRGDHVHPTDTSREAVANKDSSIPSTPVSGHYPTTSAVVSFVNSSVATNTANFLGNFSLSDLGVTYDDDPDALNVAITAALNAKTWPSGFPTNNDYVYIEVKNPDTTGVDDRVERFKYADVLASWGYEYTLNNSSFTAQEIAAIDSGITSEKVSGYDSHINDTTIHVTSTDKSNWNGKQGALPTSGTPSTTYAINVSGNATTVNGKTVAVNVPADAKFTDTTYESKSAVSGGTDVSLCTTGEKYTWNNKADNTPTFTEAATRVNLNGSNETMPTILGKVKKWFTDLKALAFKDTAAYSDLSSGVQSSLDKADSALQSAVEYVTTSSTWQTLETAYNADKTLILKVENGTNWFDEYRITAVNKSSGSDRFIFCGFPTMVNLDNGSVESLEVTEWICYLDGSTTRWINSTTVNGLELTTKGYVDGKLPASAGTSGQYLKSNGSGNAPSWDDTRNLNVGSANVSKAVVAGAGGIVNAASTGYSKLAEITFNSGSEPGSNFMGFLAVVNWRDTSGDNGTGSGLLCYSNGGSNDNNVATRLIAIRTRGFVNAPTAELGFVRVSDSVVQIWANIKGSWSSVYLNVIGGKCSVTYFDKNFQSTQPTGYTTIGYRGQYIYADGKVGDSSTPVYVDTDGSMKACSTALKCILDYGNVENQGAAAGKYGLLATMYLGNTTNSQVNASFMLYFTDSHSNFTQSISQAELRINKRVGASIIAMLTCYDSTFTDKVETIVTWNSSDYSIYVYLKSKTGTWFGVRGVPIQAGTHGGSTNTYPAIVLYKNTFSLSSTEGIAATLNTRTISYA